MKMSDLRKKGSKKEMESIWKKVLQEERAKKKAKTAKKQSDAKISRLKGMSKKLKAFLKKDREEERRGKSGKHPKGKKGKKLYGAALKSHLSKQRRLRNEEALRQMIRKEKRKKKQTRSPGRKTR